MPISFPVLITETVESGVKKKGPKFLFVTLDLGTNGLDTNGISFQETNICSKLTKEMLEEEVKFA